MVTRLLRDVSHPSSAIAEPVPRRRVASTHRIRVRRRAPLRAKTSSRSRTQIGRAELVAPTERQRAAVTGRRCIVCGTDHRIDPAQLIPPSLGGCGDPSCCVPLCRLHHRAYAWGELDLLPYLEPAWRGQLAHAVGHVGLIAALRHISGWRKAPEVLAVESDGSLDGPGGQ